MIQIIGDKQGKYSEFSKEDFVVTEIDEFQSFDSFDITVIDISDERLWCSDAPNISQINKVMDFRSIQSAIRNNKKSKVIILFPQNVQFKYNRGHRNGQLTYMCGTKLKDIKENIKAIINTNLIEMNLLGLNYGKSYTKISNLRYGADFCFSNVDEQDAMMKAENGNDVVTVKTDRAILTTIMINTEEEMKNFLISMWPDCFDQKTEIPEWINEIDFYTDKEYKEKNRLIDEQIEKLKIEREKNERLLNENFECKSILYEHGTALAQQINKMMSKLFNYDMSEFEDKYEEDGLIKLDDITFVVETKGLKNEINGKNLSDAYHHLIVYDDNLEKEGINEETKCLFIVAYEKDKKTTERSEIKDRIKTIAKANKTLIIDTRIFLKLYENFLNGKIKEEQVKELFKNNLGVLEYN